MDPSAKTSNSTPANQERMRGFFSFVSIPKLITKKNNNNKKNSLIRFQRNDFREGFVSFCLCDGRIAQLL
jgi:hypothetical protein